MAETIRKAHECFSEFSQEVQLCMFQASATSAWSPILYGRIRLGGCTAHRYGAVHRRTTSALTTSRKLLGP